MSKTTVFLLSSVLLTACTADAFEAGEADARATSTCPTWKCGFNAAEVNGHSLRELHLDGLTAPGGARLVGFTAPPSAFGHHLAVENDELVARAGTSVRRGGQLIGAVLLVALPGGVTVPVTIAGHQQVPSWAEGRAPIAAYTLVYPEPMEISGVKNVCAGDPLDPVANVVTVLGGERYDEATKTVVPGSRWFTLACPGSAAAKLSLLGYGPQSSATTVAQRQATLKMITADYCGAGTSYTQNGTPLQWANRDGSVSPASDALGPVEAVWSAHGALCLEATRIAGAQAACSLPSCAGFDLDDGEWITHVP